MCRFQAHLFFPTKFDEINGTNSCQYQSNIGFSINWSYIVNFGLEFIVYGGDWTKRKKNLFSNVSIQIQWYIWEINFIPNWRKLITLQNSKAPRHLESMNIEHACDSKVSNRFYLSRTDILFRLKAWHKEVVVIRKILLEMNIRIEMDLVYQLKCIESMMILVELSGSSTMFVQTNLISKQKFHCSTVSLMELFQKL